MVLNKIEKIEKEYSKISEELANPEITSDLLKLQKLSKRQMELRSIMQKIERYRKLQEDLKKNQNLLKEEKNSELIKLAQEESKDLNKELGNLEHEMELELIPQDPNDGKNAIVEIRSGVGGDEAELFAADLYRMYNRYAANLGFKIEILNSNRSGLGGFKEITFDVRGKRAYGLFKYESGVHRVQRIPATEKGGRIHTSTATVAILPEAKEIDMKIEPKELKIDTFCSSGHGGQSVNTTYSAIRITHLPTGIVANCQDERSQLKNKAKAMTVLKSRLLAKRQEEETGKRDEARRIQIGSGMRSEKIRTYNFPQDRITDHRIKLSLNNIENVLDGNLEPLFSKLKEEDQKLKLEKLK